MSDVIPISTGDRVWCCTRADEYLWIRAAHEPGGHSEIAISMVPTRNASDDAGLIDVAFCPWCGTRLLSPSQARRDGAAIRDGLRGRVP